ncbi:tRNA (adenosine(37)-N6)-threonylcarbamoyltransferase complex transferase subunit TsaD [Candidatus Gracilibacteria bacterium]|nr:tRNA (adenosine(37)-N6)-threonylcarbamoyltransferase complex transferase subunit TsaD [Candidatus Gracilibacteria bacterium]MCF7856732.1 tRNA (adenosine(37)-N6)-threonylcarbamoyltransferase complex transferase subunit TsaD [Candidatus Gracilibacteria bacterium]MCF7896940.1 tRNA (adenosine(37)-N6)-threonylcarbamoyltransferase complex transferase subunit TsaD [Candidatus Gracilibacteria bacterium]
MLILGIETSCDETAAAVVHDGSEVLSSVVASQITIHRKTGGVVPEVAAREHVGKVMPVIEEALQLAKIAFAKIDAIAVAAGPGLNSALLAGVISANTLTAFSGKKLIPVNHIFGHIRSNWLGRDFKKFRYPIVVLTASGGHNELVLLKNSSAKPQLIGETLDDAAGEAFDKVARLLGLPYPGGPEIQKISAKSKTPEILPRAWLLPKDISRNFTSVEVGERLRSGKLKLRNFDFSFSGLKSEVRRRTQNSKRKTQKEIADLAKGFQDSVVDVLATKIFLAAQKFKAKEIHLAGGVSANSELRERFQEYSDELKITFRCPEKFGFCTDNAAMIAGAGFFEIQNSTKKWTKMVAVNPNLSI